RQFQVWRNKSSVIKGRTDELEEAAETVLVDIKELGELESPMNHLGNQLEKETLETITLAEQLCNNLTDLNIRIEDVIHDWELYNVQQEMDPKAVRRSTEIAQDMMSWMRQLDLSPREPVAMNETTEAHDLLTRIRQLEKKLMNTEGRLPSVREVLSRFSTRLSEARDFLLNAASTVQEAEDKNGASLLKFQRKKVKQQRLTEEQLAINSTVEMSRDLISETKRNLAEVDALAQNVTEYHAEVDGASQKLTEKTERLSRADRNLVQKADDHALELERQANELEEDLKQSDANGFVQRAISAANVYNNIVKYIDDANITSLTTLNLSQRAEDATSGIKSHLGYLVKQSANVFLESVSLQSEQHGVSTQVADGVTYIEETEKIMEKHQKKLEEIVNDIRVIET
ncbi:hypothetical protein CHARACLAT_022224, partial [Characodon lateralis]|nr:hypothetical protein [Characodon lateralis]